MIINFKLIKEIALMDGIVSVLYFKFSESVFVVVEELLQVLQAPEG